MGKPITSSRTFWVNILTVAVAGFAAMVDTSVIQQNPQLVAYGAMILGVINIVLRMVTKDPISRKTITLF